MCVLPLFCCCVESACSEVMEQSLLWLIWRGVELRAREKWDVEEATTKANAAFLELMMEEETEVAAPHTLHHTQHTSHTNHAEHTNPVHTVSSVDCGVQSLPPPLPLDP
jgi:hypothetical protein